MNRPYLPSGLLLAASLFVYHSSATAQDTRAFNQNASRSNHTRAAFNQNASRSNHTRLSLTLSPAIANPLDNKKDSLLFRGSGAGFRMGLDYFFGKTSIGFSSGFMSAGTDDNALNNFMKRTGIPQDQLEISKARQQNVYLLLGPSVRLGNIVAFTAHVKGGLFINNSAHITIQQKGAQRALYRNEATDKSIFPGFISGIGVQYNTPSKTWSFGLGADYLYTQSQVMNYDARRGGGLEGLKLSRKIADLVTGITIRYSIPSCHCAARDGQPAPQLRGQNNNTVRSNRTDNALVINDPSAPSSTIGPVRWMVPESIKQAVALGKNDIENIAITLDILEQQLDADNTSSKAIINTSRSNIKSQRAALEDLYEALDAIEMAEKNAAINTIQERATKVDQLMLPLLSTLQQLGASYASLSNVLKTRHETAKNSISNIR